MAASDANKAHAAAKRALLTYFQSNGLLLCNESKALPFLELVGGDWRSIVALIEEGQAFYSKLYRNRVSYLSRAFYANAKPYKQKLSVLSPTARIIFDFLSDAGQANTAEIKSVLMLPAKAFSKSMDELFRELLVTAIGQDRTMNVNWSSFYWGTFETWELLHPISDIEVSADALKRFAGNILPETKLFSLMT